MRVWNVEMTFFSKVKPRNKLIRRAHIQLVEEISFVAILLFTSSISSLQQILSRLFSFWIIWKEVPFYTSPWCPPCSYTLVIMLLYLDMNKLNFTMKKSMTREVEKKNIFGRSPPLRVFSFSVESWLPTSVTHLLVFSYVCVWTSKVYIPSPFDVFRGSQRSRTTFFFFFHHRFCCCWSSFDYILPFLCGVCVSINISVSSLL